MATSRLSVPEMVLPQVAASRLSVPEIVLSQVAGFRSGSLQVCWPAPDCCGRCRRKPSGSVPDRHRRRAAISTVDLGPGRVTDIVDLGRTVEVVVELSSGIELRARALVAPDVSIGDACRVETDAEAVSVWSQPTVSNASSPKSV